MVGARLKQDTSVQTAERHGLVKQDVLEPGTGAGETKKYCCCSAPTSFGDISNAEDDGWLLCPSA
jgi:hypothetical protein